MALGEIIGARLVSILLFLSVVLFGAVALRELERNNTQTAGQMLSITAAVASLLAAQIVYLAWSALKKPCMSQRKTAVFMLLVIVMLAAPATVFGLALAAIQAVKRKKLAKASQLTTDMIIIAAVASFVVVGPPPNMFGQQNIDARP